MEIHGDDTNPKPIRYVHLTASACYMDIQGLGMERNGNHIL